MEYTRAISDTASAATVACVPRSMPDMFIGKASAEYAVERVMNMTRDLGDSPYIIGLGHML